MDYWMGSLVGMWVQHKRIMLSYHYLCAQSIPVLIIFDAFLFPSLQIDQVHSAEEGASPGRLLYRLRLRARLRRLAAGQCREEAKARVLSGGARAHADHYSAHSAYAGAGPCAWGGPLARAPALPGWDCIVLGRRSSGVARKLSCAISISRADADDCDCSTGVATACAASSSQACRV